MTSLIKGNACLFSRTGGTFPLNAFKGKSRQVMQNRPRGLAARPSLVEDNTALLQLLPHLQIPHTTMAPRGISKGTISDLPAKSFIERTE